MAELPFAMSSDEETLAETLADTIADTEIEVQSAQGEEANQGEGDVPCPFVPCPSVPLPPLMGGQQGDMGDISLSAGSAGSAGVNQVLLDEMEDPFGDWLRRDREEAEARERSRSPPLRVSQLPVMREEPREEPVPCPPVPCPFVPLPPLMLPGWQRLLFGPPLEGLAREISLECQSCGISPHSIRVKLPPPGVDAFTHCRNHIARLR